MLGAVSARACGASRSSRVPKELCKSTDEVLGGLAAVCGFQDGAALVGNFAEPLLIEIGKGHATWSSSSADRDVVRAASAPPWCRPIAGLRVHSTTYI